MTTTKVEDLTSGGAAVVGDYFVGEHTVGTTVRLTYAPTLSMDTTPGLAGNLTLNGFNVGTATATEIGYLSGVTSAIQTQLNTLTAADSTLQTNINAKITGPASATNNAVVRYDSTTGKLVKDSVVVIADTTGNISGCQQVTASVGMTAGGNSTAAGYIDLLEDSDNGSNKIRLTAPTSVASDKTLTLPDITGTLAALDSNNNFSADSFLLGYTTTATSGVATTLTVDSTEIQVFTGVSVQSVTLPVTSTLVLGQSYTIYNRSTGAVTVNASNGSSTLQIMATNTKLKVVCILTSGTTNASWTWEYQPIENGLFAAAADQETATSAVLAVTPAIQQRHPSAAKVWCLWNTVTSTTITASYNVSSLTDNGAGDTTVNFTVSFSSANYSVPTGGIVNAGGAFSFIGTKDSGLATGSVRIATVNFAGSATDINVNHMCAFGDQ